ncbi:MAG TPA: FliI/YscN family ATPase [Nitrospira sp.]|nr:FliI/YscN family ATPase [Nitrospira sp.]
MRFLDAVKQTDPLTVHGRVAQAVGIVIEGYGPVTSIGEVCEITREHGQPPVQAEVVGFRGERILLMPLGETQGIGPGSLVLMKGKPASVPVGPHLLGRILNGLGEPIDGRGPVNSEGTYPLHAAPPDPLQRARITEPLDLGVRALNALLSCGVGQRMGIFAMSGVGKSVLLGMIGRYTAADVTVIALIGERGREVKEFLERDMAPDALARSVVVVATSDQPPLVRIRGALLATAIAEYFRDRGKRVLLMMDSLTRLAHGQREIGLATGEPPTSKGYTPSVFALLPKLLERVGTCAGAGSITGLYTVLTDDEALSDPIAESVRSILDGHIVLSRELAERNHFPAVDILQSASRVMRDIVPASQYDAARHAVELTAVYRRSEDLITLGAYKPGGNKSLDRAVAAHEPLSRFLRQPPDIRADWSSSVEALMKLEQETR